MRYLRNLKLNVDKAEKMLEFYEQCQKDMDVDALLKSPSPPEILDKFEVHLGGVDHENRPSNFPTCLQE